MTSSLNTLLDLLTRTEFIGGLVAGTAAILFIVVVGLGKTGSGWGVALAAATVSAVFATFGRRLGLTVGLVGLLVGGWLLERESDTDDAGGLTTPLAWAALVGGAVGATIRGGLPGDFWIQFIVPTFILIFGYWLRFWRSLPQHALVGPLFLITAFGVWTTVPETETARILLGASLPLSIATLPWIDLRVAGTGSFVVAATLSWIAADGGATRPGAIVGALGSAGVLLLLPLLGSRAKRVGFATVVAAHILLVVVSARVFGLWEDAVFASVGVVAMFSLVLAGLHAVSRIGADDDVESPTSHGPT